MLSYIFELIWTFRYMALFGFLALGMIGLPIPEETLMTFIGSLTAFDHLTLAGSIAVCFAGTMTGMVISYWIGRRVGKPFLDRYGKWFLLTPARLARAEKWFQKYGVWTVSFGYFVPGVRQLTCYLAGMSRMRFWLYLVYAGSGALVWCFSFITLGRIIGHNWEAVLNMIHVYLGRGVAIGLGVMLLLVLVFLRLRKKGGPMRKNGA